VIANLKLRALALPLAFVALAVSVDCSSSSGDGCPGQLGDLDLNAACPSEGYICPYAQGGFDQSRSDSVVDCSPGFVEYTCTQKKWTLTAQASSGPCAIDSTGAVSPTVCTLGVGRCALAASTLGCQSTCDGTATTALAGSCVSGQFVVAPISCTGSGDAGDQNDAATNDDAGDDSGVVDAGGD
jgi:hypothetical protein